MIKRVAVVGFLAVSVMLVAPAALACDTSSWISTDPSSGGPGTVVTVTGAGFQAGTVVLRWDASSESGGQALAEVAVGEDGTLSAEITVPNAEPGAHKVVAEHTASSGAEGAAHVDAWVDFSVPGAAAGSEEQKDQTQAGSGEESRQPFSNAASPSDGEPVARPAKASEAVSVQESVTEASTRTEPVVSSTVAEADAAARAVSMPRSVYPPQLMLGRSASTYPSMADATAAVALEQNGRQTTPAAGLMDRIVIAASVLAAFSLLFLTASRRRSPDPDAAVLEINATPVVAKADDLAA